MKKIMLILILGIFAISLISVVSADVTIPTTTKVYFEKTGQPYNELVEYTIKCYGYSWSPGPDVGKAPGTYTPEKVYSYSAEVSKYGDEIDETYYMNYRHIDYCSLEGTADGEEFVINNIGTHPYTKCDDMSGMNRNCELKIDISNNTDSGCKNLYWIDNDNKNCSQKQFCGAYMYLGLQTFESKTQCGKAVNETISVEQITDISHKISSEDLTRVEILFSKNNLDISNFQIIEYTNEDSPTKREFVKANRLYKGLLVFLGGDVIYQFNEDGIKVYEAGLTSDITDEISIIPVISKEEAAEKASEKSGFDNEMIAELGIVNKKVGIGYKNPNWALAWKINNKDSEYPVAFVNANDGTIIYYDDGIRDINGKTCPNNSDSENNSCYKTLSNGRKAEIKIMPETASQTAIDRLGELNFTIELKEVGNNNEENVICNAKSADECKNKSMCKITNNYSCKKNQECMGLGWGRCIRDNVIPVYELTGKKEGKFLGIFKIMASERVQVDAETGEVKKVIKPWWSFLASGI